MQSKSDTPATTDVQSLIETNRRLNRRANGLDSIWQSRAMLAEAEREIWRKAWKQEFDRAGKAFSELREIYLLIEAARGRPVPVFHSVNDCCHPNAWERPGVYANVYPNYPKGGCRHERVVDAVKEVVQHAD